MADTAHNRESSALPYLSSQFDENKSIPGVEASDKKRLDLLSQLIINPSERQELANSQYSIISKLKGYNYLYAKDYLNFFLDESWELREL